VVEDKRKSSRQRLFVRGFIRVPQDGLTLSCIVRDISETGAKLRFRAAPPIPDAFELHVPTKGQIIQAKRAWMEACEVGISFERNIAFAPSSSSDSELLARMAKLEDEVASLKELLKRLQNVERRAKAA
jgi:hypothetical protein